MSVYNRKSWIHNGTKHWIHNGRHYHSKLKKKRRYNTNLYKKKINFPKKTLLSQYSENGYMQEIYLINENGKYYLEDYNARRPFNQQTTKQEITYENAYKWYKVKGKLKDLDDPEDGSYEYWY